jgi:hypothetical protein
MARKCVFCDDAPCTNEHVLPQWLRTAFPYSDDAQALHVRQSTNLETSHKGSLLETKVKVVCASCNNGWMNGLEQAVRPFLPKMIQGRDVNLTKNRQLALATWSLKTMMMFHCAHPKAEQTVIPAEDFVDLFQQRTPKESMRITSAYMTQPTAFSGRADHLVEFYGNSRKAIVNDEQDVVQAYDATLRIGCFVAQLISIDLPGATWTMTPSLGFGKHLVTIWPNKGTRKWPPASLDKIGGFTTLVESVDG